MKEITEKEFIFKYMASFLACINGYFVKHNNISKDNFMKLQLKEWRKFKKLIKYDD